MLWTPTPSVPMVQTAMLLLLLPVSATAPHPLSDAPFSVKRTIPVGLVPFTAAVKVTLLPAVAGLPELVSVVPVVGNPTAAAPQASTSVRWHHVGAAAVMLIRMRSVVYGAKVTVRLTRLLPLTVARVTQAVPFQACTLKSLMP